MCYRCTAYREDLDGLAILRSQSLYERLIEILDHRELWIEYGVNNAVEVRSLLSLY